MVISTVILGGMFLISLMYNIQLYAQREELSRENCQKDLDIEVLSTEKKHILALVARLRIWTVGSGDRMVISGADGSLVSVKNLEK